MEKHKKLTKKELEKRIDFLLRQLSLTVMAVDAVVGLMLIKDPHSKDWLGMKGVTDQIASDLGMKRIPGHE